MDSSPAAQVRATAERRSSRVNRACITCRARKQRCLPPTANARPHAPCQRCVRHGITCSFETEPPPVQHDDIGPTQLSHIVIELQRKIHSHEARIAELEQHSQTRNSTSPGIHPHDAGTTDVTTARQPLSLETAIGSVAGVTQHQGMISEGSVSHSSRFGIDNLELASPIATLRSLGALEGERQACIPPNDPIARGVLTLQEAQEAIQIYFDHCHPWAPALSEELRHTGISLRLSSPALFLAMVSVGARFWHGNSVHPKYADIVALLDKTISQLLLCPTPHDASLDSIRALMLYLQWMPCVPDNIPPGGPRPFATRRMKSRTRYNDMSAWAVFGLALRYASFLGLERLAYAPFRAPTKSQASKDDVDRMRTWLNLITYDCNLTLTSGLPASLNPVPAVKVVQDFCMHRAAQDPGDLRYGALIELVDIVQRAKSSDGDVPSRQPTVSSLKKANVEMEEWEKHWVKQLKNSQLQHIQLPFTSLRWYRLALNSSLLRPLLSSSTRPQTDMLHIWTLGFLETSVTAASQILLSLVSDAKQFVWTINSQNIKTYPSGEFNVDTAARKSLLHAVDATWISFTFALTFLVLCYTRGTVDDDLQILNIPSANDSSARAPAKPRSQSLLARLTRLTIDIFQIDFESSKSQSAHGYEVVIRDAASLVLDNGSDGLVTSEQAPLDPAIQSLFDLMDDTVYEWPTSYDFDENGESSSAANWQMR